MAAPIDSARGETRTVIAVSAGLALVVLALYAQTARFEFLALDDANFFLERQIVRGGLSWPGVWWAATTVQPNWHPLTWLTHMLDFSLFGVDAGRHHLVSAALHAANAVLLFLAWRALSGALWPSALVAALFAVHPMRAESVAWLAERKDVLSGCFWMLTLLAYAGYARRPTLRRYALVAVALALGLLSKTMLVSLPIVLLLLDAWPLGRWRPAAGDRGIRLRYLLAEKVPLFALAALVCVVTVYTQQSVRGVKSLSLVPPAWRIANAPIAAVAYLGQTVWPAGLAGMYPHPALIGTPLADLLWPALAAALGLAAVTALAAALWRTRPYLLVGWLWYLIALLPVIGLVQVGMQARADRYTYLPMIGVYAMLAWSLRDALAARPRWRVPAAVAASRAVAALAAASWRQIGYWRDSRTVYERMIAVTERNYFAHQALGAWLRGRGEEDAARHHLDEALRYRPDEPYAYAQRGLLLEEQGDRDGAAIEYQTALELDPRSPIARRRLAELRFNQARYAEAIPLMASLAEDERNDAILLVNLGTALLKEGRNEEAIPVLERVVALAPDSAQAHNNLGVAFARLGRFAEAETEFARTLAINPDHAGAQRSLQHLRRQLERP